MLPAEAVSVVGCAVDVTDAARRWAGVWERAWAAKDVDAIVAVLRQRSVAGAGAPVEPELGVVGVRAYLQRTFGEEDAIDCRFGEPVATPVCPSDDVAAHGHSDAIVPPWVVRWGAGSRRGTRVSRHLPWRVAYVTGQ